MKNEQAWPADKVERRRIADLTPYARNSRTHSPAQVEQVAASISAFGFTIPVLCDPDGGIIAGHCRVMAAARLGLTEVPVMVAEGWTEAQKRAYIIADNKLTENGGWNDQLLADEIRALGAEGFDLSLTGFDSAELAALERLGVAASGDPDAVPDPGEEPVSATGDVWICGAHRVMCGDATRPEHAAVLMGELLADACWTDPPYNVDYEGSAGKIRNDNLADGAFAQFLRDAFAVAFARMKPGAPIYVAHADTEGFNFRAAFRTAGFRLSGCLVWAKNALVLGRSDYQWQHEPVLYGWKPGATHRWYGGRKQTTLLELGGPAFALNHDGSVTVSIDGQAIVISGKDLKAEAVEPTVLRVDRPAKSDEHPTMKPVELISRMLRNSTREGDIVLDLFGGSGSVLISCEMLGRQARILELEPAFVDVIVKRWQDFSGGQAIRESDGLPFAAPEAA